MKTDPKLQKLYHCPACTLNALGDSVVLLGTATKDTYDAYGVLIRSGIPETEEKSLHVLIGKINASVVMLDSELFSKASDIESFLSVARNGIEKLALLNFAVKDNRRLAKLTYLYNINSLDIANMFNALYQSETESLYEEWKIQNKWTSSSVSSRVKDLDDEKVTILYAYISRLLHAINRDEMLSSEATLLYLRSYAYMIVLSTYHRVLSQLSRERIGSQIKDTHEKTYNSYLDIWASYGVADWSVLELTSFGIKSVHWSDKQFDFITQYNNEHLEKIHNLKFFPKIKEC